MADGRDLIAQVDHAMPVFNAAKIGQMLEEHAQHIATLELQLATLVAKLNNDAGVTDTNYAPATAPTSVANVTFTPAATQANYSTPLSAR